MKSLNKDRVEKATVKILKKGGQGVLVPGGFILTAAHCVDWVIDGAMIDGYDYIETIETKEGKRIIATPYVVEPVCDIAVLGALDDQIAPDEYKDYQEFCDNTQPVPLYLGEFELKKRYPVNYLTHKGEWSEGWAISWNVWWVNGRIALELKELIEGGTSGGPVINDRGELVGLISTGASTRKGNEEILSGPTSMPVPCFALPIWILDRIKKAHDRDAL